MITDMPRRTAWALLAVVLIAGLFSTLFWIVRNNLPPVFDETEYYLHAADMRDRLAALRSPAEILYATESKRGLLFQLLSAVGMLATGTDPTWAAVGNLLCLPVLVVAVYSIGCRIHGRTAGILAAVYSLTAPMMAWMSHHPLEDFTLVAFSSLALHFLLKSEFFSKGRSSFGFGIATGLATLAKLPFVVFAFLPGLAGAVAGLAGFGGEPRSGTGRVSRRRVATNAAVAGTVAIALMLLWYWPQYQGTRAIIQQNYDDGLIMDSSWALGTSLFVLLDGIVYDQLGLIHLLLAVAGATWAAFHPRRNILLWAWILGSLPFWLSWPNKDPRYTLPWLPVLAAWTGSALASLPWTVLRRSLIGLVVLVQIFLYYGVLFGYPGFPDEKVIRVAGLNGTLYVQKRSWIIGPPGRDRWPYPEIIATLQRDFAIRGDDDRAWVLMTADQNFYGPATLEMYGQRAGLPINAGMLFEIQPDMCNLEEIMRTVHYVLVSDGGPEPFRPGLGQAVRAALSGQTDPKPLIGSYALPGGGRADLYRFRAKE